jgi:hypothetical protein
LRDRSFSSRRHKARRKKEISETYDSTMVEEGQARTSLPIKAGQVQEAPHSTGHRNLRGILPNETSDLDEAITLGIQQTAFAINSSREERRGVKGILTESPSYRSSERSKIESFTSESQTPRTLAWVPEAPNQSQPLDATEVQASRFRSRWCILLATILLVAVVTGIAVPLSQSKQRISPTVSATAAPTAALTPAPSTGERLEKIIGFLEKISERELLENPTSPQGKAARWLANTDSARVDIDSPDLVERYLGTLFYYSTNSDEEDSSIFDYRSEKSVCYWNKANKGIFCNDGSSEIGTINLRKLLEICCLEFCCIHRFLTSESPLARSNLKGPIPSEIFRLPSLSILDLSKLLSFFFPC